MLVACGALDKRCFAAIWVSVTPFGRASGPPPLLGFKILSHPCNMQFVDIQLVAYGHRQKVCPPLTSFNGGQTLLGCTARRGTGQLRRCPVNGVAGCSPAEPGETTLLQVSGRGQRVPTYWCPVHFPSWFRSDRHTDGPRGNRAWNVVISVLDWDV